MTLMDSIEILTREHKTVAHTDEGIEFHTQPALLHSLREAIFGGMEGTGGGSAFGSKEPISPAALDLYQLIDRQITEAWSQAHDHAIPGTDKPETLAALWAAKVQADQLVTVTHPEQNERDGHLFVVHVRAEYQADQLAARWVNQIKEFFDPPKHAEITEPCPRCEERWVHRTKDGQQVRSSALTFIRDRKTGETLSADCLACGASWAPRQFDWLSKALEIDVVELAAEKTTPDPTVRISEACDIGDHAGCDSFTCRCAHHETATVHTIGPVIARRAGNDYSGLGESSMPLTPIARRVCEECFTETSISGACMCTIDGRINA